MLTRPWPGMLRGIWGDDERYKQTYWSKFPHITSPATAASRDADGNYWFMGRIDDVMNVSGHRISTTEVESALVDHPNVAEAAVCGKLDEMTGQAIYAFVSLKWRPTRLAGVRRRAARSRRGEARQVHAPEVHHVHAGTAQDAQRQDHAPAAARHRRRPHPRRHDDARRLVDRQRAARAREDGSDAGRVMPRN